MWTKLETINEEAEDVPCPREGHVAVMIQTDKMLIHGGINQNQRCFDDAFILSGLHEEVDVT